MLVLVKLLQVFCVERSTSQCCLMKQSCSESENPSISEIKLVLVCYNYAKWREKLPTLKSVVALDPSLGIRETPRDTTVITSVYLRRIYTEVITVVAPDLFLILRTRLRDTTLDTIWEFPQPPEGDSEVVPKLSFKPSGKLNILHLFLGSAH